MKLNPFQIIADRKQAKKDRQRKYLEEIEAAVEQEQAVERQFYDAGVDIFTSKREIILNLAERISQLEMEFEKLKMEGNKK